MRRRRRTKYIWFPQIGFQGGDPTNDTGVIFVTIPSPPPGGSLSDVNVFPIIPDAPNDTPTAIAGPGAQLVDFVGSEYILKRIVGKLAIQAPTANDESAIRGTLVGAGFFIARSEASENPTARPIGADTAAERKENYGPLNLTTVREPWIWRRTWCIGTFFPPSITPNVDAERTFPLNNYMGSVAEGTHIDAKTARRVGNDDRLYFAIQTISLDSNTDSSSGVGFPDALLDFRALGALRKAKGRSAF